MRGEHKKTQPVSRTLPMSHFLYLQVRELQVHLVHSKDAFLEPVLRAVGNTIALETLEFIEGIDVLGFRSRHVVHKELLCKTVLRNMFIQLLEGFAVRRPSRFQSRSYASCGFH